MRATPIISERKLPWNASTKECYSSRSIAARLAPFCRSGRRSQWKYFKNTEQEIYCGLDSCAVGGCFFGTKPMIWEKPKWPEDCSKSLLVYNQGFRVLSTWNVINDSCMNRRCSCGNNRCITCCMYQLSLTFLHVSHVAIEFRLRIALCSFGK